MKAALSFDEIDQRYPETIHAGDLAQLKSLTTELADFEQVAPHLVAHAVLAEKPEILSWLLEQGADPNLSDPFEDGHPALYWAVFSKRRDMAEMLVEAGATVTTGEHPDDGETALHFAATLGDAELLRFLIEKAEGEAAFGIFDEYDRSPLHCAVRSDSLSAAQVLLEAGADPNALVHVYHQARIGNPPIREAVKEGKVGMAELLLRHGADPDRPGLMWTTARQDLERLSGELQYQMTSLLEIAPLARLTDSPHFQELERQLQADLEHHGLSGLSIDWQEAQIDSSIVQVRGEPIASAQNLRFIDGQGKEVGRGAFGLLILTVELEFRVFWTGIQTQDVDVNPGLGDIPAHIWADLSPFQRSWLVMDSRNGWRTERRGQLRVEGETVPSSSDYGQRFSLS